MIATIVSVFTLIFATACKEDQGINTTQQSIHGCFLAEDGTPISSALVEVTDAEGNIIYSGITENDGSFTIETIPQEAENSIVSFSKEGRILQLIRLETLIKRTESNKRGDVFLDEEFDYNATCLVKVIDKATREPIEGAIVQLGTSENAVMEFRTDGEGIAKLKVISYSFYYLFRISKDAYLTYSIGFGFLTAYTDYRDYPFELEPKFIPDGTTNNSVVVNLGHARKDCLSMHPLGYRKIKIEGDNGYKDSAITGGFRPTEENLGKVKFTGLKSGIYKVIFEAEAGDYERTEQEFQLAGDETKNIHLIALLKEDLCSNNTLIINFKDENGNAISCGKGNAYMFSFSLPQTVPISNDGSATITGINKGEHYFCINEVNCEEDLDKTYKYKDDIKDIVFDCNQTISVDVILEVKNDYSKNCCDISWAIEFYVFIPHWGNYPLYNQNFTITGPNGFTYSGNTSTSPAGYDGGRMILLFNMCNGDYTVTWKKDDGTKEVKEVRLKCGKNNTVSFVLYE